MIRVLVVDDSPTVRAHLIATLRTDPEFEVVGEADNGRRALELVLALAPDVVTLDLVLPEMNGFEATEQIMAHKATPILIVSASLNRGEVFDTYQALAAGAVDVLDKPRPDDTTWEKRFLAAVRMVSKIRVITHPRGRLGALGRTITTEIKPPSKPIPIVRRPELIALGASTGGPPALAQVIEALPPDLPIVVILHIGDQFAVAFTDWLSTRIGRPVKLAADGLPLDNGVWFAPPNHHLLVHNRAFKLSSAPPRHSCQPSIDVLFESIAVSHGDRAVAALLTGMGRDGATGLLAIRKAGGQTIAQDQTTSVIYGMPREAALLGAALHVLPLDQIGPFIHKLAGGG
jgi:two-component system chemotaxis response regulator CheB